LTKGRPIHIEGRLKFEQWEQEDGQRRSKIRVVVEQFRFVDRKPDASQPAERNGRGKRRSNGRKGELVGAGQEIPI
jgi:single-strand DNA-binding protein